MIEELKSALDQMVASFLSFGLRPDDVAGALEERAARLRRNQGLVPAVEPATEPQEIAAGADVLLDSPTGYIEVIWPPGTEEPEGFVRPKIANGRQGRVRREFEDKPDLVSVQFAAGPEIVVPREWLRPLPAKE